MLLARGHATKRMFSSRTPPSQCSAFAYIEQFKEPQYKKVGTLAFVKYRKRITDKFEAEPDPVSRNKLLPFYRATSWQEVTDSFRKLDEQDIKTFRGMEAFVTEAIEDTRTEVSHDDFVAGCLILSIPIAYGGMLYYLTTL